MEKNITVRQDSAAPSISLLQQVRSLALRAAEAVRKHYSSTMGQEFTLRQTALIVNAQTAFFLTAFPVDAPIMVRVLTFAWLIHALLKCKAEI